MYNGRDGVVTDKNGLIYMRARYYLPDMKRFVNADIVAGSISNAVTLNRFAYANGNPVSLIDPFGLSAERGEVNYSRAIFVTNFDANNGGLPVLGHTQLYFLGDDGTLYGTEFTGPFEALVDGSLAYINELTDAPPMYDPTTGEVIHVDKMNYVVLSGNFNESVALAKKYYSSQNFGDYFLLFNNCSDYTDALLDVADVDGFFTQSYIGSDTITSVPVLRGVNTFVYQQIDSGIESVGNALITTGENMVKEQNTLGHILVSTGNLIIDGANVAGDVLGDISQKVISDTKAVAKEIATEASSIVKSFTRPIKEAWDWITSKVSN